MKTLAFALCFFGLTGSALADCGWSIRCNEQEFQIDRLRNDLRTLESQQSDQQYSADRQRQFHGQGDMLTRSREQRSADFDEDSGISIEGQLFIAQKRLDALAEESRANSKRVKIAWKAMCELEKQNPVLTGNCAYYLTLH